VLERCAADPFRLAYLEQRAEVEGPFEALTWVLDGKDLWSVIESAEADAALATLDDDLDLDDAHEALFEATLASEARRLATAWHTTRLAELVARVKASLPIEGFPGASALLAHACDEFEPGGPMADALAAELLHSSLSRLRYAPVAAA
jgi:hypothetical protein